MAPTPKKFPRIQKLIDQGRIEEVINDLTDKQKLFVIEYVADFNASAACLRAGYKTGNPHVMGPQLLDHPGIRAAVDEYTRKKAANSIIVKPDYVLSKVMKTIEEAEKQRNHSAVLRGCELLARHLGMFIERTEISGPNGEAIKYEQVREAANAFTRSINSIIERGGPDESLIIVDTGGDG